MTRRLTAKQEAFAFAYIQTGNASEAYRRAYDAQNMSPDSIKIEASRLLGRPHVALTIEKMRKPIVEAAIKAAGIDVGETLTALKRVNRFDIRKLYDGEGQPKPVHQLDDETAAALSHMGRNGPVPFDRLKALDMSMKHLGLYEKDNAQISKPVAIQLVFE